MTGGQAFIAMGDGPQGPAALAQPAQVIADDRGQLLVAFMATGDIVGDKRAALSRLLSLPEPQRSLRDNSLSIAALHYSILAEELAGGRECRGAPSFGPLPSGPHCSELANAFAVYRNIPAPQFRAFNYADAARWAGRAAAAEPLAYFTVIEARAAFRGGCLPQQEPEA